MRIPRWNVLVSGLLVLLYAVLTLQTAWQHEPWRDEAQPWLVARDTSLPELFGELRYEAHPGLWYLILFPFAKLGFPYITVGIVHWLLAVVTVALFLWKAPVPWLTKVVFIFSYYMFWQYVIDIRPYVVGILLLFLIAWMYPRRFDRPIRYAGLIFLLFNSNVHSVVIGAAVAGAFAWEAWKGKKLNPRVVAALALMGLGVIALGLQVGFAPPPDNMYEGRHILQYKPINIPNAIKDTFYIGCGPAEYLYAPAIITLLVCLLALADRPVPLLIVLAHLAWLFFLMARVTPGIRHNGLILAALFFAFWIAPACDAPRKPWFQKWVAWLPEYRARVLAAMTALTVAFMISSGHGFRMHYLERKLDYSGCKVLADFLKANPVLLQFPIAAHRHAHLASALPYLPGVKFWYAGLGQFATYVHQDIRHTQADTLPQAEIMRRIEKQFLPPAPVLALLSSPLDPVAYPLYRLIFKVDNTVFGSDEAFYLYARGL
ncbi:MAG: hypothetical protein KKC51_01645 [Verrucomicrobia bacterium]|nr:hypothetical protein [Verrucomicrobiota bacterium]